ncbi:MAG: HAD family hydrolase [Ruminococcaceae bacterium]|nr:HAD family hydrolase [Oscillospiraceae bacterium]
MKYQNILFDLDGTLTDPAEGITNAVAHALRRMGMTPPPREELLCFIGPPLTYGFTEYAGIPEADAEHAVELYREHFATKGLFENELYDGVPELLRSLKTAGIGIYLATSKPTVFSERILEHFGIAGYFDAVVGSELDGHRVDKTEVIRYVLDTYDIPRSTAVMVGDRKFDIAGALAEGIDAVGVTYGYGTADELKEAGAAVIATSPSELAEILFQ